MWLTVPGSPVHHGRKVSCSQEAETNARGQSLLSLFNSVQDPIYLNPMSKVFTHTHRKKSVSPVTLESHEVDQQD